MDSRKLDNEVQMTQYGGSNAKTVVQGETQNAAFGKKEMKLGSSHCGLTLVPATAVVAPFSLKFVIFFHGFLGAMRFQPF